MIEKPCGDIFAEPKVGEKLYKPHQSSEPITINPKSKYLTGKGRTFSELNLDVEAVIVGQNFNFAFENEEPLSIGFFIPDEEWSLFKQPHLGLEPYERRKMASLPKSFTPFTLKTAEDGGLDRRTDSDAHGSASDSTWLRKCVTTLGTTPSLSPSYLNENEPNNNTICLSRRKVDSQQSTDVCENETNEKENWQEVEDCDSEDAQQRDIKNNDLENNNRDMDPSSDPEVCSEIYYSSESLNMLSNDGMNGTENINEIDASVMVGYGQPQSYLYSTVGTIGSHPEPITSCSQNQVHSASHCHYPHCSKLGMATHPQPNSSYAMPSYFTHEQYRQPETQNQSHIWRNNNDDNLKLYLEENLTSDDTCSAERYAEPNSRFIQQLPGRTNDVDTLVTFLSKFDDKVAAIWGQDKATAAALASNIQYVSEGYQSTSSTPVGGNIYPWGSPTSESSATQGLYDFCAMQSQIEQQQEAIAESQRAAESFYEQRRQRSQEDHRREINQFRKPHPSNRIAIGTSRINPPKGKYTIMHSINQHFGAAPSEEEYHIVRKSDIDSSAEEKEKSLDVLNHTEGSGFIRFIPELQWTLFEEVDEFTNKKQTSYDDSFEIDMKKMQDVLTTLDLECDDELEIVAACEGDPKPFIEAPPLEDLLSSWKTHFSTIEYLEEVNYMNGQLESPVTSISPSKINKSLPEFDFSYSEDPTQYGLFKSPGKTMFPIRFKLSPESAQSIAVQTEDSKAQILNNPNEEYIYHQHQNSVSLQWQNYVCGSPYLTSSPRTPMDQHFNFGFDNGLEIQTSGWYSDANGLGSGSIIEAEYNGSGCSFYGGGGGAVGGGRSHTYLQSENCCDSGIGIDGSSRTGFYEDTVPTEFEGDYEYIGMGHEDFGISLPPGHRFAGVTNESDVDYGQFQGYSFHQPGSSSSVVSGKQGKGNRRRAKVKPCKYFLLDGSCRRGKDCKFSHDLTTCRYWAEGSCLKGESCPYLHCFLEKKDVSGRGEYRRIGSKRYHLESENDFPTLGNEKANAMMSSRVSVGAEVLQDGVGYCSSESLLMLADPSGMVGYNYDTYGGGGEMLAESTGRASGCMPSTGINKAVGSSIRNERMDDSRGLPIDMKIRYNDTDSASVFSESLGSSPSTSTCMRRGTMKGHGHNQNSNNWISSMISVKEKRRKKKH